MATAGEIVVDVVYVVLGLLPFILLIVRRACTKWDRKNDHVYEALRSPTVREARNAFDRRVALAIREAKQEPRVCSTCDFGNAARVATCVLCGAGLPPLPKGMFKKRPDPKQSQQENGTVVTDRQRRVRRRKEWTRRVEASGRVVWVHDTTLHDGALADFPAYVLQATRPPPPLEPVLDNNEYSATDRVSDASPQAANEPPALIAAEDAVVITVDPADQTEDPPEPEPETTIEDAARLLHDDLETLSLRVVSARDADAACVAFSASNTSPQSVQAIADTVENVQLAFPTKLAQFIMSMASVFNETNRTEDHERIVSRFAIHRDALLAESVAALATVSAQQARAAIRVDFVDEQGVDAGGVYREWFLLLNEAIATPEAGVFVCVDLHEQTFYLNPQSKAVLGDHHLAHVFAAGRLFGRALLEGNVTGFHLALPLLKIMLGIPVGFRDLEFFDPEVFKHLTWLLENDGVEMLGLDFTVVDKRPDGTFDVVELVPGGAEVDVTDANKREYIDAKLKYLLFDSVESQLFAFLKGVYEIVPAELMLLFDAVELDYILAGSDEIDVDDWEARTIMSRNIALHPVYFNFWRVVRELTTDEQRRLLQYATGSTRVPPGGFSALTSHDGRLCLFSLQGVLPDTTYGCIHAHACFNRLDLPMVRELEPLREAVRAVVASESIGFTTI